MARAGGGSGSGDRVRAAKVLGGRDIGGGAFGEIRRHWHGELLKAMCAADTDGGQTDSVTDSEK